MPAERSSDTPPNRSWDEVVQRAIVLQLLREDHDERWSRAELETELDPTTPIDLNDALHQLHQEGVLHLHGELVLASPATRHIDTLGMISI